MIYKEKLQESYDLLGTFSAPYLVDFSRFHKSIEFLDRHNLIKGKRALDLGSGVGIMAIALKKMGAEVTGMDKFIFPNAIDSPYKISEFEALQKIWKESGINVVEGDILEELPFPDNSFDLVTCDATIEHLSHSPKGLFKEILRVLEKDGVFLVTTPNLANLLRRVRFIFGRSPGWDVKDYFEAGKCFTGHRREFTVLELKQMLEGASFAVIDWTTSNVFLEFKRFLVPRKFIGQALNTLALPFPKMREMIYMMAKK